ncbi:uncharacterized protein TM35_000721140 [Trypanosoma theileri]|uniref:Uncharacterized protein n=1 Tax=Trypanosoma theileri TaxID=67003 RepID=A0A1X0NFM1_9TRYP|nr:uncharacterized protein TM35_000721140 [Trypanosoma theileri]ORC83411.1 hypothetical protein TM35_000721140 [Trypanosoma theileri]
MLFLIGAVGTLLSTFMSADTLSQSFGLKGIRVGGFMLVLWIIALFLAPWIGSIEILGWIHCIVFVSAAIKFGESGLAYDFIRVPLSTYVPIFGIMDILFNYALSTA